MSKSRDFLMKKDSLYKRSYNIVLRLAKAELKEDVTALISQAQALVEKMQVIDQEFQAHRNHVQK